MTTDPLARFRAAPEKRRPQVVAVGRKSDIRDWEASARLTEDVVRVSSFADCADLEFMAEDVLVFVAGWQRLVDAEQVRAAIDGVIARSCEPRTVEQ